MATTIKPSYSTTFTLTCSLNSLASSATAGRESNSRDNSSDLYDDVLVQVKVKCGTGASANDQMVYVYVAASYDGGTTWPDTVTGSDSAITLKSPTLLRLLGVIPVLNGTITGLTYISEPMSVAAAFGGSMPPKWSMVIRNYTGQALDSSAGGTIGCVGVNYQSV